MSNKKRKKAESSEAADADQGVSPPQEEEASFTRWALFEAAVLMKVEYPEQCRKVILKRQSQIDDDANEADLVAAHIRTQLREKRLQPDSCCVFLTTAEITKWLQEALGNKYFPINKATPYLRALCIPELRYSKKEGVPGWVWRGLKTKPGKAAEMLSKVGCIPRE
jgi:hypothetical protein